MGLTGKAQIANINSFYDKNFLRRALALLVFNKFAQVRNIPQGNSDTIKFRKYNSLSVATTPLTEGMTPAGSQLSVTDSYAVVQQYGDYVETTDKLKMETEDPVETEAVEVLGEQSAETLDTLTRDILNAGTTIQYAGAATQRSEVASTMKLNTAEVREAVKTLKWNKAKEITKMVGAQNGYDTTPVAPCFIGIIDPDTTHDLETESGGAWVPVEKYAGALPGGALPGEVGKIGKVRFIETVQGKVFTGAGASSIDVHSTLIFGADAYGISRIAGEAMKIIRKQLGSGGTTDPLDQRATIGWKATFVAKILQQPFLIRIEHAVS